MNVRRFALSCLVLLTVWFALPAWPQQPARLPKVAILSPARQADMACLPNNQGGGAGCMLEGLRALGYSDGRNVSYEVRFAEGAAERLPALAAELVALRPDVIYTYTTAGADAELLQLLKELAPRTVRVAVMVNPDNPNYGSYLDLLRPAAIQLGITLNRIDARKAAELPQAFTAILANRADAILIGDDVALAGTPEVRRQIIRWALGQRLPLASTSARVAPDGGLVSLGTDNSALVRRAAFYVHRILGGAKPGDLPVEQPTVFALSVNRKAATALGLTIPQALLLRADEVIQ